MIVLNNLVSLNSPKVFGDHAFFQSIAILVHLLFNFKVFNTIFHFSYLQYKTLKSIIMMLICIIIILRGDKNSVISISDLAGGGLYHN